MEKEALYEMIETGFGLLGQRLDSMDHHIGTLARRFDFMETKIDALEKKIGGLETKIDDLERKNKIVSRELKEFRTFTGNRFDDLCIKITFLEQEIGKIGAVINYNEQFENLRRLA